MRNYSYEEGVETADRQRGAAAEVPAELQDNPFARAAYEWNNALRIAAEKMWGDHPPVERKFT